MQLNPHQIRAVALAAECHPDTIRRYLNGAPQSPFSVARIERSLKKLHLETALRQQPPAKPADVPQPPPC